MKWQPGSVFQTSLKNEWPNTLLLLLLLLVFTANALGLLEFKSGLVPGMEFRTEIFLGPNGSLTLPLIAQSGEFVLLLLSGLLLALLLPLLSPIGASLLVLLTALPFIGLVVAYPYRSNVVPMQFSLLVLLVLFGINVLLRYFSETRERQKLLDSFSQYVPPEIVGELSQRRHLPELDGESRQLTVLFCDLHNFTGMSERLAPKEVVLLLNEYFTIMTGILYKYRATIDKYVGDSIMAFWGAPLAQPDHARRAVLAAFEMHQAIHDLEGIFGKYGLPPPSVGIGINTGVVNVGNMGSRYRLAYTVIGDAVNLAARLQAKAGEYGVATIVGEATVELATDVVFRELDAITVRGKTSVTRIYEPQCLKEALTPALAARLKRHDSALEAWYAFRRPEAEKQFEALFRENPTDHYYAAMLGKVMTQVHRSSPPSTP